MPKKTTQILKEFDGLWSDDCPEYKWLGRNDKWKSNIKEFITEALAHQQQEDYQWKKRFMELKNYLLFQEKMVEQNHAGGFAGDELILLETINEHVEEIEESEY